MDGELVVSIPNRASDPEAICCPGGSVVIVGANGSGKTRLGTWIELQSPEKDRVHRISAQKSLSMPDTSTPTSIELAENALIWGNPEHLNNKAGWKWQQKPATTLLNDFDKLMVYLFSEETEQNAVYKTTSKASPNRVEPPITKLDKVKLVWEQILPHRELVVGGLRIQTQIKGLPSSSKYNASEMSDGERVIFYLIGQCLAAPKNGIIVIDEPELHLHKSIQATLWSQIERLRQDCIFVYLTHDVNFAAAHEDGKKIWLKSYDGELWEWEVIEKDQNLPEALLLEVLGSRRPVLFVEGDDGSPDVSLYREMLSEYLVIPRGGCNNVIQGTKSLRANKQFHHLDVYGIIDRDRRTQKEIVALEIDGIYVLDVAEVENLFCCEEILRLVSATLSRDPDSDFDAVRSFVIGKLQNEIDTQVSLHASNEVKYRLSLLEETSKGESAISEAVRSIINNMDIHALYESYESVFSDIVAHNDYRAALRLYNRKSLAEQVSSVLGLRNGELSSLVIRMARGDKRTEVRHCLEEYFCGFLQNSHNKSLHLT